jgi:hypothetical protein
VGFLWHRILNKLKFKTQRFRNKICPRSQERTERNKYNAVRFRTTLPVGPNYRLGVCSTFYPKLCAFILFEAWTMVKVQQVNDLKGNLLTN